MIPTPAPSYAQPRLRDVSADADPGAVDISLLVVTWNSAGWIDRCIDAIPAACAGLPFETIVYDNASSDGTAALARGRDDIQLIAATQNRGFAAGINSAFQQSKGRYLFLLNPDCELHARALIELVGFLDANPSVAAAAPLLLGSDGEPQREFQLRRLPTLRTLATEILLVDEVFPRTRAASRYRYRDLDITRPQLVEQPAAAALLIRREVFEEVGPFDERFAPAWFEDVDYCRRLHEGGRAIFLVPTATATHRGGASLEHVPFAEFTDVWYRNLFRYGQKWLPGEAEWLRWIIIAGMLLRCLGAALGFATAGAGRWNAIRAYVGVLKKAYRKWDDPSLSS
jgi:N-acetylglucosaminyl-diphospho-decaprenol L-rhamnosyltransferase